MVTVMMEVLMNNLFSYIKMQVNDLMKLNEKCVFAIHCVSSMPVS